MLNLGQASLAQSFIAGVRLVWRSVLSDGIDAAVATIVAVCISTVVTLYIVKWVEPQKWRSRYGIRSLEKALEVHGWLLSILRASQEKAKRQEGKTNKAGTHLLELSDISALETIFGRKFHLLSERLGQTWYDLQKKDTYFEMMKKPRSVPAARPR